MKESTLSKVRTALNFAKNDGKAIVNFAITSQCNAKCVYCSFPNVQQKNTVKLEQAKCAIDALQKLNVGVISLTGGEPFLNPQIYDICRYAVSKGMIVYTGTNGSLITQKIVNKIKNAGVKAVWISYESSSPEEFEKNRGIPDLTEKIRKSLEYFREVGVNTFAISVINKSIKNYKKFIDLLIQIGYDKVKFDYPMSQPLKSTYCGYSDSPLLKYTYEEMRDVVWQIKKLKKSGYKNFKIINPTIGLDGLLQHYKGENTRYPCYAGKKIFYLDWDLDLYRCPALGEKFGNVCEINKKTPYRIACNKCYYQGCRDVDSFYYFFENLENLKKYVRQSKLSKTLTTFFTRKNLATIKTLYDVGVSGLI